MQKFTEVEKFLFAPAGSEGSGSSKEEAKAAKIAAKEEAAKAKADAKAEAAKAKEEAKAAKIAAKEEAKKAKLEEKGSNEPNEKELAKAEAKKAKEEAKKAKLEEKEAAKAAKEAAKAEAKKSFEDEQSAKSKDQDELKKAEAAAKNQDIEALHAAKAEAKAAKEAEAKAKHEAANAAREEKAAAQKLQSANKALISQLTDARRVIRQENKKLAVFKNAVDLKKELLESDKAQLQEAIAAKNFAKKAQYTRSIANLEREFQSANNQYNQQNEKVVKLTSKAKTLIDQLTQNGAEIPADEPTPSEVKMEQKLREKEERENVKKLHDALFKTITPRSEIIVDESKISELQKEFDSDKELLDRNAALVLKLREQVKTVSGAEQRATFEEIRQLEAIKLKLRPIQEKRLGEIKALQTKLTQAQNALADAQKPVATLRASVANDIVSDLEETVETEVRSHQVKYEKEHIAIFVKQIEAEEKKLVPLKHEHDKIVKELSDATDIVNEFDASIAKINAEQPEDKKKALIAEEEKKKALAQKKVDLITSKEQASLKEISLINDQINEIKSKIDLIRAEYPEVDLAGSATTAKKTAGSKSDGKLAKLEKHIPKLFIKEELAQRDFETQSSTITVHENEIKEAKSVVLVQEPKYAILDAEVKMLQGQVDEKQKEIDEHEKTKADYDKEFETKNQELDKQLQELEKKTTNLESELEKAQLKAGEAQTKLEEYQVKLAEAAEAAELARIEAEEKARLAAEEKALKEQEKAEAAELARLERENALAEKRAAKGELDPIDPAPSENAQEEEKPQEPSVVEEKPVEVPVQALDAASPEMVAKQEVTDQDKNAENKAETKISKEENDLKLALAHVDEIEAAIPKVAEEIQKVNEDQAKLVEANEIKQQEFLEISVADTTFMTELKDRLNTKTFEANRVKRILDRAKLQVENSTKAIEAAKAKITNSEAKYKQAKKDKENIFATHSGLMAKINIDAKIDKKHEKKMYKHLKGTLKKNEFFYRDFVSHETSVETEHDANRDIFDEDKEQAVDHKHQIEMLYQKIEVLRDNPDAKSDLKRMHAELEHLESELINSHEQAIKSQIISNATSKLIDTIADDKSRYIKMMLSKQQVVNDYENPFVDSMGHIVSGNILTIGGRDERGRRVSELSIKKQGLFRVERLVVLQIFTILAIAALVIASLLLKNSAMRYYFLSAFDDMKYKVREVTDQSSFALGYALAIGGGACSAVAVACAIVQSFFLARPRAIFWLSSAIITCTIVAIALLAFPIVKDVRLSEIGITLENVLN